MKSINLRLAICYAIFSVLAMFFTSCSNPLDKEYNEETVEKDFKRIVELGKIDSTEEKVMSEFMIKNGLINPSVMELGASYRDILEQAQLTKEKELKDVEADFEAKESKKITLEIKKSLFMNFEDTSIALRGTLLTCSLAVRNIGNKNIKAFKALITVKDVFGKEYRSSKITYYKPILQGGIVEEIFAIDLQPTKNEGYTVFSDPSYFKLGWQPLALIYEDNIILELEPKKITHASNSENLHSIHNHNENGH